MASALRQRVLSAAILLPPVVALVWFGGPWPIAALVLLAAVGGGIEAGRIFSVLGWRVCPIVFPAVAAGFMAISVLGVPGVFHAPLTAVLMALSLVWLFRPWHPVHPSGGPPALLAHLLGGAYVGVMLAFLALLAAGPWPGAAPGGEGGRRLLYALAVVWAVDTGAYSFGSLLGKRRMWPAVSPAKTWEGAAGGLLAAAAAGALVPPVLGLSLGPAQGALTGAMAGIAAQAGDLVESRFKRAAGVKDSGSFMPGHGGILDRMDSILLAAPVFYYALRFWID